MFGDKPIFGKETGKVDENGMINLPSFTGVKEGDSIVIVLNKDGCSVDLYNPRSYSKRLQNLESQEYKVVKIENLMRLRNAIESLKSSVYTTEECINQNELKIPNDARKAIGITDYFICEGNSDSLSIFSPESYAVRKIGSKK